jgi:phage terminase large subunit-like protein
VPSEDRVTAADVIEFIETCLFVPEGQQVGKPLELQSWQKDWIGTVYDNPVGTRRAILSMPRKQGKTALSACLLLAHLCGPPARNRPNSQLFSAAQSRDQAAIIFSLAAKMVRMNRDLAQAVIIRETAKELLCPELGTKYKALSAEASTAFGLSPALTIHDELGQCRGPRSPMYEALETATAAQAAPLSIIISTQAPTDADLLSILIDDALAGHDPHTVVKLYSAPTDLDPFVEETIRLANPAFDAFMNRREVLAMAADAKRMPAREAEYKNLVLNQRIEANSLFISPTVWNACGTPVAPLEGVQVYGGLDLSATMDLTALVLIGRRGEMARTSDLLAAIRGAKREVHRRPCALRSLALAGTSAGHPGPDCLLRIRRPSFARIVPALQYREDRIRPLEHEAPTALAPARRF